MRAALALILTLAGAGHTAAQARDSEAGNRWWGHIAVLASPAMEGRQTGSPGYDRAAAYVISQFAVLGLEPAGEDGFRQPVALIAQTVSPERSHLTLTTPAGARDLPLGGAVVLRASTPQPPTVDAPLVFVGYGLHLPAAGYDDFAGVDLKGKIAVRIQGGPKDLPGPMKAWAGTEELSRTLAARGAVGLVTIALPSAVEIPWARVVKLSTQPGMYLADPELRDAPGPLFAAAFDPAQAEMLFEGSGHTFAEVMKIADAGGRQSPFPLAVDLRGQVSVATQAVISPNLVARLEGTDPTLKTQYVVVSAHLDHLGIGAPIDGRTLYAGAMDDASGVASVLEIARALAAAPPKRSVLFLVVTAEEKGLLGSRYFARRPTVPREALVADLNFDMPLPLYPLKTLLLHGLNESTLGDVSRRLAAADGYGVMTDPYPDRNSFVRTDQYSFVQTGVPAMAFKFGFELGSPEQKMEMDWRHMRYHAPADDLDQPVDRAAAADLDAYVTQVARAVADAPDRPTWKPASFFARFAQNP